MGREYTLCLGNLKTNHGRTIVKEIPLSSVWSRHHSPSKEAMAKTDGRKTSGLGVPKIMTENRRPTPDSREAFAGIGQLSHKEPCMSNSFH